MSPDPYLSAFCYVPAVFLVLGWSSGPEGLAFACLHAVYLCGQ